MSVHVSCQYSSRAIRQNYGTTLLARYEVRSFGLEL